MFISFRHFGWVFSILLHLVVLFGSAYVSTGKHVKIDLNRKMYEVNLVGPPNKGKAGAKGAPKPDTQQAQAKKKPDMKKEPEKAPVPEQKKPEKKAAPPDTAKPILKDSVNATKVAEAKPEEVKKEEPKKEEQKKEEPKKEESKTEVKKDPPKKDESKNATAKGDGKKEEKKPSKEDVLAQALKDAGKVASSSSDGKAKDGKGSSSNAVADALAALGQETAGRGTSGDGTAEDGPGEGESSGSLEEFYGTQVKDAIRPNWRYPRVSSAALVTTVELKVNQGGEILAARIINGSGRSDYDASVMRAIAETKQLPRLPETLDATLIINFNSLDLQ